MIKEKCTLFFRILWILISWHWLIAYLAKVARLRFDYFYLLWCCTFDCIIILSVNQSSQKRNEVDGSFIIYEIQMLAGTSFPLGCECYTEKEDSFLGFRINFPLYNVQHEFSWHEEQLLPFSWVPFHSAGWKQMHEEYSMFLCRSNV